ncbi:MULTISPECIES: metal ABC transporter ATP-binding protein [Anaerotruncus]|uniref:metal ABC transporter ATP-binding protein n=1 Tax=Anaerotruncus TaxID=244127 RepID=UPI00082C7DB6|nr:MULTISPECIES: ABC transporter ATP-binding protein [Anaerotruncus]RGX54194.1 ABC transporter ATP-binding protein [Anaerotruncus sp. AF02-27]
MTLISCKNVSMRYENQLAVENVSFDIEEGDYVCIVGENGSGKSTLLKGLLGLMQPSAGTITFGGGLTRDRIGYLPQQTVVQRDFPASVREVVLSGCLNRRGLRPFYSEKERRIAAQNIERLGIGGLSRKSYRDLSGGQQQRVLLARALCATEKLLLLDEPVTGLDPVVTADMYTLLRALNQDGVTVIMVSHDINCSVHNAGKILHMDTTVRFYGSSAEYLKSDICRRFLGGDCHD